MRVEQLRIERLRNLGAVELAPAPGFNWLVGANGAGKTSVLEALHLLGYGRSFRRGGPEVLIQRGAAALQVFARIRAGAVVHALGFERGTRRWQARVDGDSVPTLTALLQHCALVCFEPGSHALIGGGSDERRRFVDWGLFHVEPTFLLQWRRYHRALKQRNALLKQAARDQDHQPWELELADSGARLHDLRAGYIQRLAPVLAGVLPALAPSLGAVSVGWTAGWRIEQESLADALQRTRLRDRDIGHTTVGPHRADWRLEIAAVADRDGLSRGQEKLAALAVLLAQATLQAEACGDWPILALDDLPSELDRPHLARTLDWLSEQPAQVWISATERPLPSVAGQGMFHVEQGRIIAASD